MSLYGILWSGIFTSLWMRRDIIIWNWNVLSITELLTWSPLAVAGFSISSWCNSCDPGEPSNRPSLATFSRWGCSVSVSARAAVSTSVKPQELLNMTSVEYIDSLILWERYPMSDFALKYLITLSSALWYALPVLKYYSFKTQGTSCSEHHQMWLTSMDILWYIWEIYFEILGLNSYMYEKFARYYACVPTLIPMLFRWRLATITVTN